MKRHAYLLAILVMACTIHAHAQINADSLQANIQRIVEGYVKKHDAGVCVGVIHGNAAEPMRRTFTYGKRSIAPDAAKPDTATIYHIGSTTKSFTAMVLAMLVAEGRISLADPVNKYLPLDSVTAPHFGSGADTIPITILDLATHYSGLPDEIPGARDTTTVAEMYTYLNAHELKRAPGQCYNYSNLGISLLGVALSHTLGMSVDSMFRTKVTDVLGMNDTKIFLDAEQLARRATPIQNGDSIGYFKSTWPAFYAAGGLYSTITDMMKYLQFVMGLQPHGMAAAIDSAVAVRRVNNDSCRSTLLSNTIGLVWQMEPLDTILHPGLTMIWKDGVVPGSCSFIGFANDVKRELHTGVVVMANNTIAADSLGHRILKYLNTEGITSTGLSDDALLPTLQARPNPTTSTMDLHITLPAAMAVRIDVVDAFGRLVATVHDGLLDRGPNTFTWDARTTASGTYRCSVAGASFQKSMPLIVVH